MERFGIHTVSLILLLILSKKLSSNAFGSSIENSMLMEEDEWQMVQKKGNQFVVNDQPFYVNGFNTYWLMVLAADESSRGKVTEVFKEASSVGMTVCRTWGFNDGQAQWKALQKSPSVYDEDVFKVLLNFAVILCTTTLGDYRAYNYNHCFKTRPTISRFLMSHQLRPH